MTIDQVGEVALGPAMQRGQAELDGEGVTVGGIVVMRYRENALDVIERVKQRLEGDKTRTARWGGDRARL